MMMRHLLFFSFFIASIGLEVGCTQKTQSVVPYYAPEYQAELLNINEGNPQATVNGEAKVPGKIALSSGTQDPGEVNLGPVEYIKGVKVEDVEQQFILNQRAARPKLDLLFVIDNSTSMKTHRERLSKIIEQFVAQLSRLSVIDFQIGVTSIYDSRRYFKKKDLLFGENLSRVSEWKRTGEGKGGLRNFERLGKLLPLSGPNIDQVSEQDRLNRFLKPNMDAGILAETLTVPASPYVYRDVYQTSKDCRFIPMVSDDFELKKQLFECVNQKLVAEATGPEFEELLSPMMAALNLKWLVGKHPQRDFYREQFPATDPQDRFPWDPPEITDGGAQGKWLEFAEKYNAGFVRPNANLGVIFLADSVDLSPSLNPEAVYNQLVKLKGDESKVAAYGILHKRSLSRALTRELEKQNPEDWKIEECYTSGVKIDQEINQQEFESPQKLEQFLHFARGDLGRGHNIINLCAKEYGKKIIGVAKNLFKQSFGRGEYSLIRIPLPGTIKVFSERKDGVLFEIPSCADSKGLCWKTQVRRGARTVIISHQEELEVGKIVLRYRGLDPTTASQKNTRSPK